MNELSCSHTHHLRRTRLDVVTLEFAIERGAADAEGLACHHLVSLALFEDAADGLTFHVLKIRGVDVGGSGLAADADGRGRGDRWRQIGDIDDLVIAERDGTFNTVFQLADIARPIVLKQAVHHAGCELQVLVRRVTCQERLHQRRYVGLALAQRRQMTW